jgi:hypothetical protein
MKSRTLLAAAVTMTLGAAACGGGGGSSGGGGRPRGVPVGALGAAFPPTPKQAAAALTPP